MRRIYALLFIILFVSGCSRNMNSSVSEQSSVNASVEKTVTEGETESITPAETTENETETPSKNETTENIKKETVVLNLYDQCANLLGIQTECAYKVLLDELNIKLNDYVDPADASVPDNLEDVDIIMFFTNEEFLEHSSDCLILTDELLKEKAPNIWNNAQEYLKLVNEITGGEARGISRYMELPREGYGWIYAINVNSKHKDEAIKYLDWLYSVDTMLMQQYGPKGICWDVDEEGAYYLTEAGKKLLNNDSSVKELLSGYGFVLNWTPIQNYAVVSKDQVIPGALHGETFDSSTWKNQ